MKEVLEFLKSNKPFYLATMDGDQARVRPLGFVMEYDGKIFFGVGNHKNVYRQLKASPKVEISGTDPESNWVRITGRAVFDERPEVIEAAFTAMPQLKNIYNDPKAFQIAPFYLADAEAGFFDMKGGARTVKP
ncbi:MAG: pyridoxamine 5'-phosphate oxidase family protein [Candidatus Adiutrix sp.]|jgi:uncharacterized pyridoxamine 5'-phosphate oxidase family protein|nr:pyridoxamine 5'-phosphate oxidase family protein [Candidatus Adiutrix sp.]